MVNRIFPRHECIWIDGGTVEEEAELWQYILDEIGGYTEAMVQQNEETGTAFKGNIGVEAGIPLIGKSKGQTGFERQRTIGIEKSRKITLSPRAAAVSQLRNVILPVVIDDFHYLNRKFQGNLIRALKPLIFEGLPVVLIAIPHRRYDAVKVEREMTGRLESIDIPTWEKKELLEIANQGFPLLNLEVELQVSQKLSDESYGSPHLMQEFCKELAKVYGISQTLPEKKFINVVSCDLFEGVAEGTGKVVFDNLAKGPRPRTDRIQRLLKNGETADIYRVTLYALSSLEPGLDTIEYEKLRSAIREVLKDNVPQAHEVTRVLSQMAKIAATDEASTPVLDWEEEEQKLHITDPFFAFYLKWGVKLPKRRWVEIEVISVDRPNILADIVNVLTMSKVEVLRANISTKNQKGVCQFTITMADEKPVDQQTIDNIFAAINNIKEVISVK